jgi:hypothetical protein
LFERQWATLPLRKIFLFGVRNSVTGRYDFTASLYDRLRHAPADALPAVGFSLIEADARMQPRVQEALGRALSGLTRNDFETAMMQ